MLKNYFRPKITTIIFLFLMFFTASYAGPHHDHSVSPQTVDEIKLDDVINKYEHEKITAAVNSLIDTLSPKQREMLIKPFSDEKYGFNACYVLDSCNKYLGLRMYHLNYAQIVLVNKLLNVLLSSHGYATSRSIINAENLINEVRNMQKFYPRYLSLKGPTKADLKYGAPETFNPSPGSSNLEYYLAIYGDASSPPWGVKFEGHHLSINFTFDSDGSENIQVTPWPLFLGVAPMIVPEKPRLANTPSPFWEQQQGDLILWRQSQLARDVVKKMTPEQQQKSNWGEMAPAVLFNSLKDPAPEEVLAMREDRLLSSADLTDESKHYLRNFFLEYINVKNSGIAGAIDLNEIVAQAKVSWYSDDIDNDLSPFYFRVVSGDFLVELVQGDGYRIVLPGIEDDATHIHTAFRNLADARDFDVIGEHVNQHH
jgi:hypothetical protein